MSVEFNSLSCCLMVENTNMVNSRGPGLSLARVAAELGYVVITLVAVVETCFAFLATAFSKVFLSDEKFQQSFNWLKSSATCIIWAFADIYLNTVSNNLSCRRLVAQL